jgi:hypothetical protein
MPESPLFAKSYDLLRWLIPVAIGFPRSHRFVLSDLGLLGHGQYRHVAALLAEVGRLLGGWIKTDNARRRAGDS